MDVGDVWFAVVQQHVEGWIVDCCLVVCWCGYHEHDWVFVEYCVE